MKSIWLGALLILVSCSSKGSEAPTETRDKVRTIVVKLGEGVGGYPAQNITTSGAPVAYSYNPAPGYKNVVVEVDRVLSPPSGIISTTRDTVYLGAVAERSLVVTHSSNAVVGEITGVLNAPSPQGILSAYSSHIASFAKLYASIGAVSAREAIRTGYRQVMSATNSTIVVRMHQALSGKLFGSNGLVGTNSLLESSNPGISVIYVPGILFTEDAGALVVVELTDIISKLGLSGIAEPFYFYNASSWSNPDRDKNCKLKLYNTESLGSYADCYAEALTGDFVESSRQIANIVTDFPHEAVAEAKVLAEIIKNERRRGRCVVLVAHSQGNLMVREALKVLGGKETCIEVLSLAAPLGRNSWIGSGVEPHGFVVGGFVARDIILALGSNDFPLLMTDLAVKADERATYWRELRRESPLSLFTILEILESVKLHYMTSYLAGDKSREKIASELDLMAKNLLCPSCRIEKALGKIYASSGVVGETSTGPSDLWEVEVFPTAKDTRIGRIRTFSGEEPAITDLALCPNGKLWGTSFEYLYEINSVTAAARNLGRYVGVSGVNALTCSTGGFLYAATEKGEVLKMDIIYDVPRVLERVTLTGVVSGGDLSFTSSGDLYLVALTPGKENVLARVQHSPLRSSAAVSSHPVGFTNVWGLGYVSTALYGLTFGDGITGELIGIDVETGKGVKIRNLSFPVFGGAARRTR